MVKKPASLGSEKKSFKSEIRTPRAFKAANPLSGRSASLHRPAPASKFIRPKVSPYTEFSRDRAEKLATLRRGKVDEFTWAAIGGFLASVPGTAHSIVDVHGAGNFSLSFSQFVDFAV